MSISAAVLCLKPELLFNNLIIQHPIIQLLTHVQTSDSAIDTDYLSGHPTTIITQ